LQRDAFDSWGPAVYLFEPNDDLVPVRQIEVYDGGRRLLYDADHGHDGARRVLGSGNWPTSTNVQAV